MSRRDRPGLDEVLRRAGMDPALEGAKMRASAAADDAAEAAADRVAQMLPAKEIRKRSLWTLRCSDCRGMPIAYVTRLDGRLAVWTRPRGGGDWPARFIDVATYFGATDAWCLSVERHLDHLDLAKAVEDGEHERRVTH